MRRALCIEGTVFHLEIGRDTWPKTRKTKSTRCAVTDAPIDISPACLHWKKGRWRPIVREQPRKASLHRPSRLKRVHASNVVLISSKLRNGRKRSSARRLAAKNGGVSICTWWIPRARHCTTSPAPDVGSDSPLIAIPTVNTVATSATSTTVITRSLVMDNNLFASEVDYQISLSIAESLLRAGHLTNREFIATRTLLLETYRPPIGILLAEVGWLSWLYEWLIQYNQLLAGKRYELLFNKE